MTTSELKEYIFNKNKIEYILDKLGCQNIKYHVNQDYFSSCQPDGDNPQGVNIKNNKYLNYRSYTRNVDYEDGKDIIDFVESVKKCSFVDAVKYLHKVLGLKYEWSKNKKIKPKKHENPIWIFEKHSCKQSINVDDIHTIDENILNDYVSLPYIGWVREGIMPWSVKKFGLAYSYRRKRVIIPMRHWETGELLGINSRTIVDNYNEFGIKKYYITPSYKKSLNLFGLYENRFSIENAGYIVLVEAEKSVLKRDSLNDSTLVALSGHSISDEQVSIILGLNINEVIVALDKDIPLEEIRHICEKFYGHRKVSYIYDKWDILGDKDSPADAKNKVYKFLMKHKVTYDYSEHCKYIENMKR